MTHLTQHALSAAMLCFFSCFCLTVSAKNGFDLSNADIPPQQILHGGPPRDGIPAIDKPEFIRAQQAQHLQPTARILGLAIDGLAKAYPINIMNWHEIVNDAFDSKAVVISYCPLCGTGLAFLSPNQEGKSSFGVSGLLYQSDVLMYDRETFSLWSQILAKAISGPLKGQKLHALALHHTSWKDWQKRYPNTLVLSQRTGSKRNYAHNPYTGYSGTAQTYFPTIHPPPSLYHPKEQVLGVRIGKQAKAYPFKELSTHGKSRFEDLFAGHRITINWNEEAGSATASLDHSDEQVAMTAFWFAWYTFHPKTKIFKANKLSTAR